HRVFAIKNTTEHPHKLSSQIVKEHPSLLSKEAGILPTFSPLSTNYYRIIAGRNGLNSLCTTRQIYLKFAALKHFSLCFSASYVAEEAAHYTHRICRRKKNFMK
ncbi:MAG: hypothetical protein ABFS08_12860, partial [Pseudomonadota bacterium]